MSIFLYLFFHNETNDRSEKGLIAIPKDKEKWPLSWKKISYKEYSLFKPIPLIDIGGRFWEILQKRRSNEGCILGNSITLEKIAFILKCGYGLQTSSKLSDRPENRTVPSAGKMYPLEVYLFLFQDTDGYKSGIYHYGIQGHVLEPVMFTEFSQEKIHSFCPQESVKNSQGMICLTSVFGRTTEKYGSRGYRYILLEAGHVAQNILLAGTEQKINFLPIGGSNEDTIEEFIGLGSSLERVVYTLFF